MILFRLPIVKLVQFTKTCKCLQYYEFKCSYTFLLCSCNWFVFCAKSKQIACIDQAKINILITNVKKPATVFHFDHFQPANLVTCKFFFFTQLQLQTFFTSILLNSFRYIFTPKMDQIRSNLFVSFLFFLLFSSVKTEDQSVIQALITFMDKLAPMQTTTNWGWNISSDPCTSKWVGVTCDGSNVTVKKIVLENLNLSGTLDPVSLCKVSNLLVLSLNFNNLTGILSPEISNCNRLTHFYLTGNRFSGNLPDSITNLPNVKRIVISNNDFSGDLPDFSRTTTLLTFLAQNNQFTGQLPGFNYNQLQDFNIANNNFTGPVPDDTGRFDGNSFAGNPGLCGKVLPRSCPVKKKEKESKLRDFFIYSGYAVLGFLVVVLVAIMLVKRKKRGQNEKTDLSPKNSSRSGRSSESRNSKRSEFSLTSVENGGVSTSMVVLSSPVGNGLRFEDLLRAPAELISRGNNGSLYKVKPEGGVSLVVKRIKNWKISKDEFKKRMQKIDEIKHSNVLPVVAYYSSKQEKLLVYEYQQNGSLFRLLHGEFPNLLHFFLSTIHHYCRKNNVFTEMVFLTKI